MGTGDTSTDLARHTAGSLAERFGLGLRGDPATPVAGVATLASAGRSQLSFLANPRVWPLHDGEQQLRSVQLMSDLLWLAAQHAVLLLLTLPTLHEEIK